MTPHEEFICLYSANHERLLHYIVTLLPNRQDAEDLLQDTSIILLQKFSEYQRGSSFFAWAARIAFYETQNLRRSKARAFAALNKRVATLLSEEAIEESHYVDFSDSIYSALQTCMNSLSTHSRELLMRRYADGADGNTLESEFKRSKNTLFKALERIRSALVLCVEQKLAHSEELA